MKLVLTQSRHFIAKISTISRVFSPTAKIELMKFIGSLNFYSKYNDKLHVNMKTLYDWILDNVIFQWNKEPETLFQQIKTSILKNVTPPLPSINHPIVNTVDSFLFGIGCVPFQMNDEGKLDSMSYNSCFF